MNCAIGALLRSYHKLSTCIVCFTVFVGRSMADMKLDELNELEDDLDEEDEKIFEAYR